MDAIREQQAEADAIRLKRMQLGSSSNRDAVRCNHARLVLTRHYHTKLLVHQSRGLRQTCTDVVKEVRPQKHIYVCSEERTVIHRAVLTQTEVRAPPTSSP